MPRRNSCCAMSLVLAATTWAGGTAMAQSDLVTLDRIGPDDAANTMTFRINATQSNNHPRPLFADGFTELYQAFAEAHPGWRIDIQTMTTDITQEHARLLEQAKAGRAPDCSAVDSFQLPLFIQQGALQPVTQYFSEEEIDDLFPFVREGITGPDGEIYAWWWNTDLRLIYRNTELVPEAPETWEDLQAAALQAKEAGAAEGIVFNAGRWEGATFDWLAYFWAQGGELLDEQGTPVFFEGENREHMLDAIAFYQGLVESGGAPERVVTITTYDDLSAAALSGQTGMFQGGHWQNAQLEEAMDAETFAKWEVSLLPGETADQRATGTGGWAIAPFTDDPEKAELCMEFVREVYMGSANEVLQQIPTRASLFELDTFDTPFFDQMRDYLQYGRARPGFPIYPEISNQIQIMLGEVLSGAKEPEQALDDAAARVQEAFLKL